MVIDGARLLQHQGRQPTRRDHRDISVAQALLADHAGDDAVDLPGEPVQRTGLERLDGVLGDDRAGPQQLDLAQLGAAVAERLQGDPDARRDGAPTYSPRAEITSKVVAVPKSTTMAGPPCRWTAASALTMRSVPTSRGCPSGRARRCGRRVPR